MTKFAQKSFPKIESFINITNLCVDVCGGEKELK